MHVLYLYNYLLFLTHSESNVVCMKGLLSMDYQKEWVKRNDQRIAEEKRKRKVRGNEELIGMRIMWNRNEDCVEWEWNRNEDCVEWE